ncbi:MAG: universal stress protein [Magnetococcales bacterium]|nr:universal stress protein [Magnetococcales bacterium]
MSHYQKIFAVIELNDKGSRVARQAWQLARAGHATLAISVVVDYTPGYESGHVPFMTPRQMKAATMIDVSRLLDALLADAGVAGAERIVIDGSSPESIVEVAGSWGADLLVVGSHATHGLVRGDGGGNAITARGHSMDLLAVNLGSDSLRGGWRGRLVHALSGVF